MKFIDLLKSIYASINNKQVINSEKKRPGRKEQDEFLNKFQATEDPYSNSYNKYRCVCFYHYSLAVRLLYNAAAFIGLMPMLLCFSLKHGCKPKYDPNTIIVKMGLNIDINDIFPDELRNKYTVKKHYADYSDIYLDKTARKIIANAFLRHPLSFHYILVLMIRLAAQCSIICKYNPAAVATYVCEREFSDPLLTYYSLSNGVEYHGFMHGDFMYQIDHAFLQYSCYWVWDIHYINMFKELKCAGNMKIYRPAKYMPLVNASDDPDDYEYYATYYFSGEKKTAVKILKNAFDILKIQGKKCKIRPHPRFSNNEMINEVFKDYLIEDCRQCSLEDSLKASYLTVALNSTVLSQAYHSGKKIVIDDISDPEEFNALKEKEYILLDKADFFLSQIINMNGVKK